jgi:hypothetical protein
MFAVLFSLHFIMTYVFPLKLSFNLNSHIILNPLLNFKRKISLLAWSCHIYWQYFIVSTNITHYLLTMAWLKLSKYVQRLLFICLVFIKVCVVWICIFMARWLQGIRLRNRRIAECSRNVDQKGERKISANNIW